MSKSSSKRPATPRSAPKGPILKRAGTPASGGGRANSPDDGADDQPLSIGDELFCQEYLNHHNATRAYKAVHPECKDTTASTEGARLLAKPRIAARIEALAADRVKELEIDGKALLRQVQAIATADHRHLSEYRWLCCRHCHGTDHKYQFRLSEFETAKIRHEREQDQKEARAYLKNQDYERAPFDEKGGPGFNEWLDPHPECPNCHGVGEGRIVIADTRRLPPEAAILYAGVEETKDGLKVHAHDKLKAMDMLFKHAGLYEKDNAQKVQPVSPEALTALAAVMEQARARQLEVLAARREQFPGD